MFWSKRESIDKDVYEDLKKELEQCRRDNEHLRQENERLSKEHASFQNTLEENKLKNALTHNLSVGCIDNIHKIQHGIESNISGLEEIDTLNKRVGSTILDVRQNVNSIFNTDSIIHMANDLRTTAENLNSSV